MVTALGFISHATSLPLLELPVTTHRTPLLSRDGDQSPGTLPRTVAVLRSTSRQNPTQYMGRNDSISGNGRSEQREHSEYQSPHKRQDMSETTNSIYLLSCLLFAWKAAQAIQSPSSGYSS